MDLLASYDDGSSTPKTERNGEESNTNMAAEYERMMNSLEFDAESANSAGAAKAPSPETTTESLPWLRKGSDASSSGSESSSEEDSGSEDEETKTKKDAGAKRKGSASTDYSSDSSSASGNSKQEKEVAKAAEPEPVEEKDCRPASTSSHKAPSRRFRSRSKERRHRRPSDRRRRSSSRSKDRRHRHHRSERRPGHRSRSRSKDRHSRMRSSKDRRRKDGRRRKRSGSRDAHRRRRRHPSSHRRHHRSRSPEHKKSRAEKVHKSRSRSPPVKKESKPEEPTGVRPPAFRTVFGRGRGNPNGFKEQLRKEFIQNCSAIQTAVSANPNQPTVVPSLMKSNVATASAGLGVAMGGLTTAILNQMQQAQKMAGQQMPGGLTQEQMMINQRAILQATGRTREQVEAETGMKVPEYYNEVNFNVKEWAEREKKRKTLFKKKPETEQKTNQFSAKALLPGADQAQAEKFSRLLGVKKHQPKADQSPELKNQEQQEAERQDHILEDLSKSYDSARVYTHLARGSGLGYSSTMYQPLG